MRLPTYETGFAFGQGFVGLTADDTIGMGRRRTSRLPVPHLERGPKWVQGREHPPNSEDRRTTILRALSGVGATPSAENVQSTR